MALTPNSWHSWNIGDVVTKGLLQAIQDQTVNVETTTTRDALSVTSGSEGCVIYNTTTNRLEVYSGSSWGEIAPTNAATATALETARTIGGVSFDGTANIDLPGVNLSGNQNTSGNAATASHATTATSATTAGTVTTTAQPSITSVGTLTSLTVSGNIHISTSGDQIIFNESGDSHAFRIYKNSGGLWTEYSSNDGSSYSTKIQTHSSGNTLYDTFFLGNLMTEWDGSSVGGTTGYGTCRRRDGDGMVVELVSSRRFKTNIRDIPTSRKDVADNLRPVVFNGIEDSDGEDIFGLIAEEVYEVWPEAVNLRPVDENDNAIKTAINEDSPTAPTMVPWSINYEMLVVPLIMKVQSLEARLASVEQVAL